MTACFPCVAGWGSLVVMKTVGTGRQSSFLVLTEVDGKLCWFLDYCGSWWQIVLVPWLLWKLMVNCAGSLIIVEDDGKLSRFLDYCGSWWEIVLVPWLLWKLLANCAGSLIIMEVDGKLCWCWLPAECTMHRSWWWILLVLIATCLSKDLFSFRALKIAAIKMFNPITAPARKISRL